MAGWVYLERKTLTYGTWDHLILGTPTIAFTTRRVATGCTTTPLGRQTTYGDEPVIDIEMTASGGRNKSDYRVQLTREAFNELLRVAREAGWAIG